jgi:hypothetical protein
MLFVVRYFKHWRFYLIIHEWVAHILDLGSVVAILILGSYKGGKIESNTLSFH